MQLSSTLERFAMRATNGRNLLAGMLLFGLNVLPQDASFGADQPAAKEPSSRVEYARISVQIARLNLQSALLINQRNPNTLPKAQITILQEQVALADEWAARGGRRSRREGP